MILNRRLLMIGIGTVGVVLGVAFAIGVAYGRGDPKTVETGLTQQQIASLLGGPDGTGGTVTRGNTGTPQLLGNNTIGQVSAIEGQTITVKTAQAEVKVTIDANTRVSRYGTSATELQVGDSVVVAGARQADGSVQATSVSEMPPELAALAGGSAPAGSGRPGAAATATP
jgi:hypothetical protein